MWLVLTRGKKKYVVNTAVCTHMRDMGPKGTRIYLAADSQDEGSVRIKPRILSVDQKFAELVLHLQAVKVSAPPARARAGISGAAKSVSARSSADPEDALSIDPGRKLKLFR